MPTTTELTARRCTLNLKDGSRVTVSFHGNYSNDNRQEWEYRVQKHSSCSTRRLTIAVGHDLHTGVGTRAVDPQTMMCSLIAFMAAYSEDSSQFRGQEERQLGTFYYLYSDELEQFTAEFDLTD